MRGAASHNLSISNSGVIIDPPGANSFTALHVGPWLLPPCLSRQRAADKL